MMRFMQHECKVCPLLAWIAYKNWKIAYIKRRLLFHRKENTTWLLVAQFDRYKMNKWPKNIAHFSAFSRHIFEIICCYSFLHWLLSFYLSLFRKHRRWIGRIRYSYIYNDSSVTVLVYFLGYITFKVVMQHNM